MMIKISILVILIIISATFIVQTVGAKPAEISVEPQHQKALQGSNFSVNITIDPMGDEVFGAQYELYFNTTILNATSQTPGTFLSQDGATTAVVMNRIDNTIGKVEYGETRIGVENGVTARGTLASITFEVMASSGASPLNLTDVFLMDPFAREIPTIVKDGTMEVGDPLPFLVIRAISNTTISPNGDGFLDSTEIKVEFSELVAATISIEDGGHNLVRVLYSNESVKNPESLVWYGNYANGTVVQDGTYYVNVTMDDRVNPLVYDRTLTIIVDTTPPTHSNESPSSYTGEITPLIAVDVADVSDVDLNSIKLYIENILVDSKKERIINGYRVSYQTEYPYPGGSSIPVEIIAEDTVGNKLDFLWNFSVDLEPPNHSNETPPPGGIANATPMIAVDVTDEHGVEEKSINIYVKNYRVIAKKESISNGYRVSYRTERPFRNGDLIPVRIIANDTVNNTLDFSWNFSVDAEPPKISILSPTNRTYAINSINLNYTISEPVTWTGYSLDGKTNVTIEGNTTLANLSEGWHILNLYATDVVANIGHSSVYFVVDTMPPRVISSSPTGVSVPVETRIMITFSEKMNRTSVEDAFSIVPNITGSLSWDDNTLIFIPDSLAYGTKYNITIKGNAKDSVGSCLDGNGNGIAEGSPADDFSWRFTTIANMFDTREGTYPSISGVHRGIITLNQTTIVSKMYTYPCIGTGGHSEYVRIYNESGTIAEAHWDGYTGDYHNISFDTTFILEAGKRYNYTIRTGSYPQIHHTDALPTASGWINCTEFVDANGKSHDDWIPAIRLFYETK